MSWLKCDHAADIDTMKKRLADVDGRLLKLELDHSIFRDKVLRKIQKAQTTESVELGEEGLYNKVLIPMKE